MLTLDSFSQSPEFVNKTTQEVRRFMEQREGDTFISGMGNDVLAGGYLADTFVFDAELEGHDTVLQLDPWDTLQFNGFGYESRSDAVTHMRAQGRDVIFTDQGVTLLLADQTLADIQSVDFAIKAAD